MSKETKIDQPTKAEESMESKVARLTTENKNLLDLAEKSIKENQLLKATVKALSQLI